MIEKRLSFAFHLASIANWILSSLESRTWTFPLGPGSFCPDISAWSDGTLDVILRDQAEMSVFWFHGMVPGTFPTQAADVSIQWHQKSSVLGSHYCGVQTWVIRKNRVHISRWKQQEGIPRGPVESEENNGLDPSSKWNNPAHTVESSCGNLQCKEMQTQ